MNGKDEPVVSIIMPVRDAAATLEDAIDSISKLGAKDAWIIRTKKNIRD